jgi:glycerate dehydrogenase
MLVVCRTVQVIMMRSAVPLVRLNRAGRAGRVANSLTCEHQGIDIMAAGVPLIVVLDGYALNPGDLSWERLAALGECHIHDRSDQNEVRERAREAEIVLTNKVPLGTVAIASMPKLRYIGVTATGFNIVDIAAARAHNVTVTNVPIYGTSSVAQMVFAHLLNLTQNVGGHAGAVREGRWSRASDWCFWDTPLVELEGMTMGIVGLGRIGRATARLAQGFGMHVIAHSRRIDSQIEHVDIVDVETLFGRSDVVSLHCPLTPETEKLVNRDRLTLMKPSAFFINTSRGQLVDETALADALNKGQIAGAGLDVLAVEPPLEKNPLVTARNCYVTPHIAWATRSARRRLLDMAIDNVAAFLAGNPVNVVN